MKKILLTLLLIPSFVFAQKYEKLDSLQFKNSIEQLLNDTGKKYILISQNEPEDSDQYYRYAEEENRENILLISYKTRMDGANADLNIKGIKKWEITKVFGSYLALFPIWKKYYQYDADIETITKQNQALVKGFPRNYFKRYEGKFWEIRL